MLNGTYAAVCGVIYGNAADYFRYASVAVEVADRTVDSGLQCASYVYLTYACYWTGRGRQGELLIEKLRLLAGDNPLLGTEVTAFSPLLSAQFIGQRIEGFTRDALSVLRDCPGHRQLAVDNGFPDAEIWWLWLESEPRCALGGVTGAPLSAPTTITRVETLGLGNEVIAILIRCYTFAVNGAWEDLLATASEGLQLSRDAASFRAVDAQFFAHVARATLEIGQFENARDVAEAGVRLMRESKCVSHPQGHAMLARAQIALRESAVAIAATLDEYASLLAQMEFHLFEGELHELRAQLADRECHRAEQMASIALARDCYARFGMATHVARIDRVTGLRASH